ncbi:hypothetical protein BH20ACT11_BH20ACT11_13370 [soil metagenome]
MFRKLLEAYPRADGTSWSGPKMEHDTGGLVNSAYFSNLLNGRINQPGLDKLKAIADVMDFPAQLWLEDPASWGATGPRETLRFTSTSVSFAELLNGLFEASTNEKTGEHFSPAEIAYRTSGQVTELQVQQMRDGYTENPNIETVLALSEAFGIDFSYWFRRNKSKPLVEDRILEALRNEDSRLILARSSELSKDQKDMLLVLMEQLKKNRNV